MSLLRRGSPAPAQGGGFASAQTSHVGVEAIAAGVVRLAGGHHRAVLEIGSVNLALQAAAEQEATLAGYAAFLNSLTYPVQILVRLLPVDCEAYLRELEHRAQRELREPLAGLALDHVAFVRRLARERTLLERRVYVVIPADGDPVYARSGSPLGRWFGRSGHGKRGPAAADSMDRAGAPDAGSEPASRQLEVRCEEVARQLARCELSARRLGDAELAELFYSCWCPDLARVQRLRHDLAGHTGLAVRRGLGATGAGAPMGRL